MQMLFPDVLVDADNTPLDDAEEILYRVRVYFTTDIFLLRMGNGVMAFRGLSNNPLPTSALPG